ncbi:MAG TPA: hypothetical protein VLJ59_00930 [Mycobacteriales bacterium]|nr:hypothetical protein [Mycobacteriales bacterium]
MHPRPDDPSGLLPPQAAAWRPGAPPVPPPVPAWYDRPPQPPQGVAPGAGDYRDDTTRYLCAATHLSSRYADAAIREFLVEPTRPVPPSPGVDAAAVLSEAVAARTRRKLRDSAVVLLFIPLLFTAPVSLLVFWFVVGLLILMAERSQAGPTGSGRLRIRLNINSVAGVGTAVVLGGVIIGRGGLSAISGSSSQYQDYLPPQSHTAQYVVALFLALAILGILVSDRLSVWSLLTKRFRRYLGTAGPGPWTDHRPRQIHDFSPKMFMEQLKRYRTMPDDGVAAEAHTPLIVYRDYTPFVGAGQELNSWSSAVTLTKLPDDEQPPDNRKLTTAALYKRVREELADLSRSTPLTPGRRLHDLKVFGQVIVSADELIDHLSDPRARTFLVGPDSPPSASVPAADAEALKLDAQEWARYYLCFQVETWDRDLVVSVYLHMAVDERTLYIEWTPCVLMPVPRAYQRIDTLRTGQWRPFGQALLKFLGLPATLPRRVAHTLKLIRPIRTDRGIINPDRYGSLYSLRELAADKNVQNYFQRADVDRYLKILESRYILAVSRILREFGYSSHEFEQQAAVVVNQHTIFNGSNINAPVVVGSRVGGNVSSSGTMNAPPADAPAATPSPQ